MIEIKIPSPGESITEVELTTWFVLDGDFVEKNQELAEIESDKATLTITATEAGILSIKIKEGTTAQVGQVACEISPSAPHSKSDKNALKQIKSDQQEIVITETETTKSTVKFTPVAKKMLNAAGVSEEEFLSDIKRFTSKEVGFILNQRKNDSAIKKTIASEERTPMSNLRKKISQRLVQVKNETAMLTTFNEINMHRLIELRASYKDAFFTKYGIKLGYMSFFTKAAAISLKQHPTINAMIDGDVIVRFNYADIGIAVQTPKGLMVPVVRQVNQLTVGQIEQEIARLADKARSSKISLDEMSGGTFSITNGGVFGSLLSTPIINPPQSAILGMHNIVERPIAENGQVVIRPMMYVALSYDHRLVDGKDSVTFLRKIKTLIEQPELMLFEDDEPAKTLILG